jgi:tRNA(fMet)-specific endonuclease VapC
MLDTDTCSNVMRGRHPAAAQRLIQLAPRHAVVISVITAFELRAGALAVNASKRLLDNIARFIEPLAGVLPFDEAASDEAAAIDAALTRAGDRIGGYDVLIAGHARSVDAVVVTHNTREFERVEGLKVEDWS